MPRFFAPQHIQLAANRGFQWTAQASDFLTELAQ